jgi:hypothetical protein
MTHDVCRAISLIGPEKVNRIVCTRREALRLIGRIGSDLGNRFTGEGRWMKRVDVTTASIAAF